MRRLLRLLYHVRCVTVIHINIFIILKLNYEFEKIYLIVIKILHLLRF